MKNEKGFSLIEVIVSLLLISGAIIIILSELLNMRIQSIKMIKEKALIIEYHHIMEMFYIEYDHFDEVLVDYYDIKDSIIYIKPYELKETLELEVDYKVVEDTNYISYLLYISFPDDVRNNNIKFFDDIVAEIIVYEWKRYYFLL